MAQSSRPQQGNRNTNPTYVDSGPYTGDQWATLYRVLFTGDQQAAQGVLKGVWNELAPTHTAALNVSINTGAGVCNGHVFFNDTSAVSITVDGGASRGDALCMVENNTNAALAAGAATIYNTVGNANIPPYSCRLAVVKDETANFTQTNALYMVKLATFTTGAANITGFTDARDYCEFSTTVTAAMIEDRTRCFLVFPATGYNNTSAVDILNDVQTTWAGGLVFPNNANCETASQFCVPRDYYSSLTVSVVVWSQHSGNIYHSLNTNYCQCGESYLTHSASSGALAEPITADIVTCNASTSLTNLSAGDIVRCHYTRDATNMLDTVDYEVRLWGFLVSYTADS